MSISDLFRTFFGFNQGFKRPDWGEEGDFLDEAPNSDDILPGYDDSGDYDNHNPGGPHHHGDPSDGRDFQFSFRFGEPDDMMRHFEEMFKGFDEAFRSMGVADFPGMGHGHPGMPGIEAPRDKGSLRDRMLKEPDSESDPEGRSNDQRQMILPEDKQKSKRPAPFLGKIWDMPVWNRPQPQYKMDTDLDEQVKNVQDLAKILTEPYQQPKSQQRPESGFKSISVHTYRSADGKVEERRTVRDGVGHEETTVTRKLDGQTHRITTQKEPTGSQEVKEDFINMDERDRNNFEHKWEHRPTDGKVPGKRPQIDVFKKEPELHDEESKQLFRNLFGEGFPGFGKR